MEKTKPDLMAAAGTQRHGGSKRILAQLEHGPRPPARAASAAGWTIDGWTIGLFALLLLMCSVAWLMHDQTITPKTFRRDYSSGSSSSMVRPTVEGTPAQEQPAIIVNEAVPRSSLAIAAEPVPRSAPMATAVPRPAASATRTAPATATPAARAATAPAPTAAPPATTASSSDTDVTLLTALMAHTSKPAVVTPERPRDVVERQEGDTTAQLLARCKQLGLIEGMLCRSRICSGRWEADAACRAPH